MARDHVYVYTIFKFLVRTGQAERVHYSEVKAQAHYNNVYVIRTPVDEADLLFHLNKRVEESRACIKTDNRTFCKNKYHLLRKKCFRITPPYDKLIQYSLTHYKCDPTY